MAQAQADPRAAPYEPFRISPDVYYVGAADYAAYLIRTKAGDIVIDAPLGVDVAGNIRKLGFDPKQVKILLNTHGHFDHAGGFAELKRQTGAKLYVSQPDGELIARGGKGDFFFGDRLGYEPVKPDRLLKPGETVSLGGLTLTANLTPGHTKGCTTWTFRTKIGDSARGPQMTDALVHCSSSVLPGYRLVGNETYPGQRADYERSYAFWLKAPCQLFLASHTSFFGLAQKQKRVGMGNAFVDPEGCKAYYETQYRGFQAELARQQAAAKP